MQRMLLTPVRLRRVSVTGPLASYSRKTKSVAAGAVASEAKARSRAKEITLEVGAAVLVTAAAAAAARKTRRNVVAFSEKETLERSALMDLRWRASKTAPMEKR